MLLVPGFFFAVCMGLLSLKRAVLLTALHDRFMSGGTGEVLTAFAVGLRFDVVMSCMLAVPAFLLLAVSPRVLTDTRAFRCSFSAILSMLSVAVVIVIGADFFFFKEFGTRLDWKVFSYWQYDYVQKMIFEQFPGALLIAAALVLGAGFFWLFRMRVFWQHGGRWWQRPVLVAVGLVVLFLGIRNSVGPKPINSGPAYFSGHFPVAQLTLNSLFTLREAAYSRIKRRADVPAGRKRLSQQTALSKVQDMLRTERSTFTGDHANPLFRRVDTGRERHDYNVVVVVMESLSWHYMESLGGRANLTPNLDRLGRQGILMERCFAVGHRTTYGFSGIVGGFPDLAGQSATTRPRSANNFYTLGRVLRQRDYQTMFIYGGQAMYDHRQTFLGSNGFETFVTQEDFQHTSYRTELGWCDGDLVREAHGRLTNAADAEQPFFAVMLTLSFHRPYKIPSGKVESPEGVSGLKARQFRSIRYTDWAMGRFIEKARKADYFDNTIFVFVADHSGGSEGHPISPASYRIPFIIYAPDILADSGRRISKVVSQTDVPPTILGLLGGTYKHGFFGSDVLAPQGGGFALMRNGSHAMALMGHEQRGVIVPFHGKPHTFRYQAPANARIFGGSGPYAEKAFSKLNTKAWAVHQTAFNLFYDLKYRGEEEGDVMTATTARDVQEPDG